MNTLARNWGWVALRGAAGLVFGLLTLFNPAISLAHASLTEVAGYGAKAGGHEHSGSPAHRSISV